MPLETLNDRAVSWAEIKIALNVTGGPTLSVVDIKAIDHESKVDVGVQRGASGGRIMKRTTGQIDNTGTAEFYRSGFDILCEELAKVAPEDEEGLARISLVQFDIIITHSFEDDPVKIYQRELLKCRLLKDAGKYAEGTDPETVSADINPMRVVSVFNGRRTVLL